MECEGDSQYAVRRLGASGGGFRSTLRFGSGFHADVREESVAGSFEWHPRPKLAVGIAAGAVVDGRLETGGTIHDVGPGYLAALTASWPIVDGADGSPFVLGSVTAGMSHVTTTQRGPNARAIGLTAIDARVGVAAGKSFGPASPYLLARVFGGPVFWQYAGRKMTGTDTHHVQLGLGLVVRMPGRVDLSAEFVPVGERALAVGVDRAF
jgi:hypothetical protein